MKKYPYLSRKLNFPSALLGVVVFLSCWLIGTQVLAQTNFPPQTLLYPQHDVQIFLQFEEGPLVGRKSVMQMQVKDRKTQQLIALNETIKVTLWMPDMGHGSAPTKIQQINNDQGFPQPGLYRVSNMQFVMGGIWEVYVTLVNAEGQEESQFFTVAL